MGHSPLLRKSCPWSEGTSLSRFPVRLEAGHPQILHVDSCRLDQRHGCFLRLSRTLMPLTLHALNGSSLVLPSPACEGLFIFHLS